MYVTRFESDQESKVGQAFWGDTDIQILILLGLNGVNWGVCHDLIWGANWVLNFLVRGFVVLEDLIFGFGV